MAKFVYLDETGATGKGAHAQPLLTLVAAVVDETQVRPLASSLRDLTWKHVGYVPENFEFHGYEIWQQLNWWKEKTPQEVTEIYEELIGLLELHEVDIAYSSINKANLHSKYGGQADDNSYVLALQFLLEKVDKNMSGLKVVIADEAKENQLRAVKMVGNLQEWGSGEIPGGKPLTSIIDSMHFVTSHVSPGVQVADLAAYALQRVWNKQDTHPNAVASMNRIYSAVRERTVTWRQAWP